MTKISSPFVRDRELIVVQADVAGPTRTWRARLVLDTGAAATTLTPQVVEKIGYSRRDGYKKARFTPPLRRSMATGFA
jgi:predicted aspartyl protease